MITDLDIWRSANVLIARYGEHAPRVATMKADAFLAVEKPEAHALWMRIHAAVLELRRERPKGESLN